MYENTVHQQIPTVTDIFPTFHQSNCCAAAGEYLSFSARQGFVEDALCRGAGRAGTSSGLVVTTTAKARPSNMLTRSQNSGFDC